MREAVMIRGQKTAMRPVEPADLPFLRELANDRAVASSVVGWDFPLSDYGQAIWWESAAHDARTRRFVVLDEAGTSIGLTGLWDIDWHDRHALTAVKFHPGRVIGKGIATDSIKTLMAYAFHDVGLHRLWGEILSFNGASMGAYVKNCGWRIEGVLREHVLRGGRYCDAYRVAALKEDLDRLKDARDYVSRVVPVDTDATIDIRPGLVGARYWSGVICPGHWSRVRGSRG
jgi:RimJ/RimL family protein N-acetyltransferase